MSDMSVRMLNQELGRLKRGEEIVLTERGRVIARIVPACADPLGRLIGDSKAQPATTRGPTGQAAPVLKPPVVAPG